MVTIYEVAKAAGVSPKTVSRVLNGEARVGEQTKKAVNEAIAKLGYVPSNAARMMRSNRSGLIGLITGALSQNLEPSEPTGLPALYIVQGIQQALADSNKTLMIADAGGDSTKVPQLMQTFLQHRVEALIYVADHHKAIEFDSSVANCPVVLVNGFDNNNTPAVVPDDQQCQFDLVSALVEAGHKRIAYLTLANSMVATQLRIAGYKEALTHHQLPYDSTLVACARKAVDSDDGQLLQQELDSMLNLEEPPTAICCGNDEMAMRLYALINAKGLRIPQDISVVGFDNYRVIAETLSPPLTTVELPYFTMGQKAATHVMELIKGEEQNSRAPLAVRGPVFQRSSVTALDVVPSSKTAKK